VAGLEPSEEAQMKAFRKVLMLAGYAESAVRHVFLCVLYVLDDACAMFDVCPLGP
jgi:hypothetical protein